MSSVIVAPFGSVTLAVPASAKVATFSTTDEYGVLQNVGYPNFPAAGISLFQGLGGFTSAAYTLAGTVTVNAGSTPVLVNIGASAAVYERLANYQPTPGTLNATGTLTAALILGGIVTSTTGAGVTATLDTGTIMDAAVTMAIDDSFDWTAIATGANAFTVTAAAGGHTVVGSGVVATLTSGRFRTRKTAANTFVTYRLS